VLAAERFYTAAFGAKNEIGKKATINLNAMDQEAENCPDE